jgi:SagB-type dehydrogenase family enzyme
MATQITRFDRHDPLDDIADAAWTAGGLDEFSNQRFVDRLVRFDAGDTIIDPLTAPGPLTPLRPVRDRFQRQLEARRSTRTFGTKPLDQRSVEHLLAATGVDASARRVVPSAGGLRSVTTYAICANTVGAGAGRIVRYDAAAHAVNDIAAAPDTTELRHLFNLGTDDMPAVIVVFVCHLAAMRGKYSVRGDRFALVETGCAAQNIELRLARDGLAGYQLGGTRDEVLDVLELRGLPVRITGALACGHQV